MKVRVLVFGQLVDIVGLDQLELDLVGADNISGKEIDTVNEVLYRLKVIYPGLADKIFLLSLNRQQVMEDSMLEVKDGDELALMPPFSGG